MIRYDELSYMERGICGICAILLLVVAVMILVASYGLHMGKRYFLGSCVLLGAVFFLLQGIDDFQYNVENHRPFSFLAAIIGKLPIWGVLFLLVLFAGLEGALLLIFQRKRKKMLTPGAIKESLDALPDGVCFAASDGQPLLVNTRMQQISGELLEREILNAQLFLDCLANRRIKDDTKILRTHPTIMVCTEDGRVWDFHKNTLSIRHFPILEIIAYDVTGQYHLSQELDQRNERLVKVNERLRQYSRDIEQVTRENEILTAKIQVHDEVGHTLLAARSYLMKPRTERNRQKLLSLWGYTIAVLRNEAAPVRERHPWELLQEAARAVNVTIEQQGELPETEKESEIVIGAVHECLTNTIKHAKGDKLNLLIRSTEEGYLVELTNNGTAPKEEIKENGGLKNLRCKVEAAGGRMYIISFPRFLLRIHLPKGETGACLDKNPKKE